MQKRKMIYLCLLMAVWGCSKGVDVIDVTILPNQYAAGKVNSGVATEVVDEVVRQRPNKVHIHTCTATPPEKVQQFNTELNARLKVDTEMTLTAKGC